MACTKAIIGQTRGGEEEAEEREEGGGGSAGLPACFLMWIDGLMAVA